MISVPVRLWIPPEVKILNYHIHTGCTCCQPTLTVKFETPVFVGEISANIYTDGKIIEVEEGYISGSYKYTSNLEWTWNHFEYPFKNQEELEQLFQKILSGEPLLEEAKTRKTIPKDLPHSFRDGYGPSVYKDIVNAYKRLFGKPTQALVGT